MKHYRFNSQFKILVTCSLLMFGCSKGSGDSGSGEPTFEGQVLAGDLVTGEEGPLLADGSEAHGGDGHMLLTSHARKEASDLVSNLDLQKLPKDTREDIKAWIAYYKGQLAFDILNSAHRVTREGEQQYCAVTKTESDAEIYFSLDSSRKGVHSLVTAKELLIHESTHHLGVIDDEIANGIALAITGTTDVSKHPDTGFWSKTEFTDMPCQVHHNPDKPYQDALEYKLVPIEDKIYLFGIEGEHSEKIPYRTCSGVYDTKAKTWQKLSSLEPISANPDLMYPLGVHRFGSKIAFTYRIYYESDSAYVVSLYDPANDIWETKGILSKASVTPGIRAVYDEALGKWVTLENPQGPFKLAEDEWFLLSSPIKISDNELFYFTNDGRGILYNLPNNQWSSLYDHQKGESEYGTYGYLELEGKIARSWNKDDRFKIEVFDRDLGIWKLKVDVHGKDMFTSDYAYVFDDHTLLHQGNYNMEFLDLNTKEFKRSSKAPFMLSGGTAGYSRDYFVTRASHLGETFGAIYHFKTDSWHKIATPGVGLFWHQDRFMNIEFEKDKLVVSEFFPLR